MPDVFDTISQPGGSVDLGLAPEYNKWTPEELKLAQPSPLVAGRQKPQDIFDVVATESPKTGFMGTVKDILGGAYKGKKAEELPGFWSTLISGPIEAGKEVIQEMKPPAMRTEKPTIAGALKMLNLFPMVDFINALSARTGKTAYELTGSPAIAGAVDLATGLAAPWGLSAARKIPRVAAALERVPTPTVTAMPKGEDIERVAKEVGGEARLTPEEFGEKYKYPVVPKEGEEPSYYGQAYQAGRKEAALQYGRPAILAEGLKTDAKEVASQLRDFTKQSGISFKIAPTTPEKFAAKAAQTLDPISEEQQAYETIKNLTVQEMQQGLNPGRQTMADIYRYLFKSAQAEPKTRAGQIMATETGKALEQVTQDISLPKEMDLNDLIGIRQRLNGAKRAARNNDALTHQFNKMKEGIDSIIEKTSPKVREALRDADTWYVTEYLPSFGPKGALRKLTQKDAGLIVDELVPKGKKFEITEKRVPKLPAEAKTALQSAWVENLMRNSRDVTTGEVKPGAFLKNYQNYSDRTKWALLGGKKPQMDDLIKSIQQATQQRGAMHIGRFARYGGAALPIMFGLKDIVEYQFTGNKRLLGYAGADFATAAGIYAVARPAVIARMLATKAGAINALKTFVRMPEDNPNLIATGMNVMTLLKQSQQELDQEDTSGK